MLSARGASVVFGASGPKFNSSIGANNRSQTLAYAPGGSHVGGKSQMPKLDLATLKALGDPTHRFNYSVRSLTHDEREAEKESARNTYRPGRAPAWLKHDREVMRFFGFFQEPVYEDPKETYRVRHVVVYFYLEDGTMMISEPKMENSGMPQGTFIKRHRIPKAGGGFYSYQDLSIGAQIMVYSRTFRLSGADDATRSFFFTALGIDLGADEDVPQDPFRMSQMEATSPTGFGNVRELVQGKEYNELANGGARKNANLQQYLENDRRVLCFKCFWDDPTRYGSRMYYTLHYYLADDSVEVLDSLARNSGRDPYPVFWRRSPLRRNPHISPAPGMIEPEAELYKPEDFVVGGEPVCVYGRDFFLYDCDEFTREFYRKYMNHEQDEITIAKPEVIHVQLTHPPHTGFGTEEDSLASCKHLTPRPPKKDEVKLMDEAGQVLRYLARIEKYKQQAMPRASQRVTSPIFALAGDEDEDRRFIVGFYTADGSVGVWEQKSRNSGHSEGKFAQKTRKKNPNTGKWYVASDFVVGQTLEINAMPFTILEADERTQKYMDAHPEEF